MSKQPRMVSKTSLFSDSKLANTNNHLKIRRRKSTFENDTDYDPRNLPRKKSTSGLIELQNKREKVFCWEEYLKSENAAAVPPEVFSHFTKNPSSILENKFKIGYLLEAVDPEHQSLIGLVSVVNIIGQRLRLHFEGFPSTYDFWVYCDSPFIFPCGFCSKTERQFAPPPGFKSGNFDWNSYASNKGFQVAPEHIFENLCYENNSGFKIADRLEAVDRQHPELICVASIADALGDFVLVHFDGWNSYYDYWTSKTSVYIKPVGWCSKNSKKLSPPLDLGEHEFKWKDYLTSKDVFAADDACFSSNVHKFEVGMKLEVVDPRNLILTRVASIVGVEDYRILIHFDGWSDQFNVWMEIDNRNLHPIGWSEKCGEIFLTPYDTKEMNDQDTCSVPNCLGHGHIMQDRFASHHSDFGCPYSPKNLNRESISDRFQQAESNTSAYDNVIADFNNHTKPDSIIVARRRRGRRRSVNRFNSRRGSSGGTRVGKNYDWREDNIKPKLTKFFKDASHQFRSDSILYEAAQVASIMEKRYDSLPSTSWQNHVFSLPDIKGKTANDVNLWTVLQVASFVEQLTGKPECAEAIRCQEIDGKAFLMLTQSDITSIMKLKLGPSLKISSAILSINERHNQATRLSGNFEFFP